MDWKYFLKETLGGEPVGRSREEYDIFEGRTKTVHYETAPDGKRFKLLRNFFTATIILGAVACNVAVHVSTDRDVAAYKAAREASRPGPPDPCVQNPWAKGCP